MTNISRDMLWVYKNNVGNASFVGNASTSYNASFFGNTPHDLWEGLRCMLFGENKALFLVAAVVVMHRLLIEPWYRFHEATAEPQSLPRYFQAKKHRAAAPQVSSQWARQAIFIKSPTTRGSKTCDFRNNMQARQVICCKTPEAPPPYVLPEKRLPKCWRSAGRSFRRNVFQNVGLQNIRF